jgi:hypothetical protein
LPASTRPTRSLRNAFDPFFHSLAQPHQFRNYLAGLLAPRDRPETLTALAGAEPLVEAQTAPVQQLQFFLTESCWDADLITMRTLQLLGDEPLTASDADGVLVIDDTIDRSTLPKPATRYLTTNLQLGRFLWQSGAFDGLRH